jgi:hypothetical protein
VVHKAVALVPERKSLSGKVESIKWSDRMFIFSGVEYRDQMETRWFEELRII